MKRRISSSSRRHIFFFFSPTQAERTDGANGSSQITGRPTKISVSRSVREIWVLPFLPTTDAIKIIIRLEIKIGNRKLADMSVMIFHGERFEFTLDTPIQARPPTPLPVPPGTAQDA